MGDEAVEGFIKIKGKIHKMINNNKNKRKEN